MSSTVTMKQFEKASSKMKSNFYIKYRGHRVNGSADIDLAVLGESIIGFDALIKEIFKISKLDAELKVNICGSREGSLIIDIANVVLLNHDIPFTKALDLLTFLSCVDKDLWLKAKEYFSPSLEIAQHTHRTVNDYFAKNPLDQQALTVLVSSFIGYIFGKAQGQKKYPNYDELPRPFANDTHKMIKKHKFKKAIKPLIDEKVSSIEVSSTENFEKKQIVSAENFENYLSEDEMILPQYVNGETYMFTGKIVGMQCSKGDSLKLQVYGLDRRDRELIANPPEGKTTKDLESFYEEGVLIKAEVVRTSLYKKPTLLIQEISLYQQPLFSEKNN